MLADLRALKGSILRLLFFLAVVVLCGTTTAFAVHCENPSSPFSRYGAKAAYHAGNELHTMEMRSGFFASNDPVNHLDPTGRCSTINLGDDGARQFGINTGLAKIDTTGIVNTFPSTGAGKASLFNEAIALGTIDRIAYPTTDYIPAPTWLIGSPAYYAFRWYASPDSYKADAGPEYLMQFGYKNINMFNDLAAGDDSSQLKNFVVNTGVALQTNMEGFLQQDPSIATSRGALLKAAYDSHADSYEQGGFGQLQLDDKMKIITTPDWEDSFGNKNARPVMIKSAPLFLQNISPLIME